MKVKIVLSLLVIFLLFISGCHSLTVAPTSITSKTVIKSEVVKLGAVSFTSGTKPKKIPAKKDTTIFTIQVEKELIIQCKKLVLNRNIAFTGQNVTIIIEYEELQDNFHTVQAALGATGSFRFERKVFE